MSEENLFGSTTPNAEGGSAPEQPVDPATTLLQSIRNEAGEPKYADVPTALKALEASQAYIPDLQSKLDAAAAKISELELKAAKAEGLEEAIQRLDPARQDTGGQPAQVGLDAEAAAKLFDSRLQEHEAAAVRKQNTETVTKSIADKFGEKAEEVFYSKGEELGLSRADLNNLAGTSPAAVLALFGEAKASAPAPTQGSLSFDTSPQDQGAQVGRRVGESVLSGATTFEVRDEFQSAKELAAKVNEMGMDMYDLSDPKAYRKFFGK